MSGRRLGYTAVALLKALEGGHRYGLDMMAETGLPSGTVYPTLSRLEKRSLVRAKWEKRVTADAEARPRRRYYEMTSDGKSALRAALADLQALAADPFGAARAQEST